MAGNTKLMGFGANNLVQLMRWGRKVSCSLPTEAIQKLRGVCYDELPVKPQEPKKLSAFYYDDEYALAKVELSMDDAGKMRSALEAALASERLAGDATISNWIAALASMEEEHKLAQDTSGEPGVDGDGTITADT